MRLVEDRFITIDVASDVSRCLNVHHQPAGDGDMGGSRSGRERAWPSALLLVVFLSSLLLAIAWDVDGDPTTDNLPAATLTISPRTVCAVDAESDGTAEGTSDPRPSRRWRLGRRRQHFLRDWIWQFVAIPSRGP